MSWEHDWKTVTDEISREAVRVFLVGCDVLKCLPIIWVAEEGDGRDVRGCVSGDLLHAQMDDLCALAAKNSFVSVLSWAEQTAGRGPTVPVAREDNLCARTLADSLVHQRCQCGSTCGIAALEISCNCSRVVHALYSEVLAANYIGEGVEERRPG
jgi:hypothetical protein